MTQIGTDSSPRYGLIKTIYLLLLFVVPYFIISLPGSPQWLYRAIAVSMFFTLITAGTLWYGLSSKTRMILPGGKLNEPQFDNIRPRIEKGIRITVVIMAVFFAAALVLPFMLDLIQLGSQEPTRITATPVDRSVPLFGVWFLEQSVQLSRGEKNYDLYYSWEPLRVGEKYEFFILPRSRLILEFRKL